MFADPAVVTVNAVAKNLIRINQDGYSSEYLLRAAGEEFRMRIRNSSYTDKKRGGRVDRHTVELVNEVYAVAPAIRSTIRKTYVVIENDVGDTLTDPIYVASALLTFLTAGSNANIVKLLNTES
jgi:hypothetical protein